MDLDQRIFGGTLVHSLSKASPLLIQTEQVIGIQKGKVCLKEVSLRKIISKTTLQPKLSTELIFFFFL